MQKERTLSVPAQSQTPSKRISSKVSGLNLSETQYPARLRMPRHQHELPALSFVLAGGYAESVGAHERECMPLSLVFHPRGESHSVVFHQTNVRIFRVEPDEHWLRRMQSFQPLFDEPAEFNGGLLAFLMMRLYGEIQRNDCWSALSAEGLMLEVMAELGRATEGLKSAARQHWLEEVREILRSRLAATPSLTDLAESAGVHPVHLTREFRKRFGCTIGDYVRRLRIEQACAALTTSDAPVSEIALAAGFYDQSHFSNTFKKLTGLTPAAWRANSIQ